MDLKTAYKEYFKIGVALSRINIHTAAHVELMKAQFNSFTAENDMKPQFFLDRESCKADPEKYDLAPALRFKYAKPYLDLAKENGISMRGHTLVWHNQTPKWFFHEGYNEFRPLASRETMLKRLEAYIRGVLEFVQKEYPGVIYAWDVVNEAVDDGGWRKSPWQKTVGEDFVEQAFRFARKYAAPGVALFYNDYETAEVWKRDFILENILKPLNKEKLIDGMGMQSHLLMDHPDPEAYRTALEMFGATGLQIQVTELDMHNADPSESSQKQLGQRYREFFHILKEAKISGKANVTGVTFWNLRDEDSWLSGFRGETSYPLLFNGKCEAKPAYYEVLKEAVPEEEIDEWKADYPEEAFKTEGLPEQTMRVFPRKIWEEGEYDYPAAYGFVPNFFAYLHPDEEEHDCMLVLPGGGYCMCCAHEGELPAKNFFDRGMNVFVMSYTTDITMSVPLKKQPLKDISRAVRYIRKNAELFGLGKKKLLICGFSAAAHVCGSLAVHFADVKDENPEYAAFSNRPDGVILSYPVITTGEFTHKYSIEALLGKEPSAEELEYFSLEKQVKEDTPPCFLWQTECDDVVPVENSYLFAMALRKKKVPFAHYVFPKGHHGLSTADATFFGGWSGGEYTMQQTMRAVHAVKDGKGVNVSEQRKLELMDQFFGDHEEPSMPLDRSLMADVGLWTDLAWAWIGRL
ncbi:MAG: endo-1,4-beta-xylanase [Lachnospiraceae bacterium]|nr:endo-1,4-beta-xylanase [Lachnospiraceae bacterium]